MAFRPVYALLLLIGALCATPNRTQHFPAKYPLEILNVAGDPHGLIWLAAGAEGVWRFDGLHYEQIPGYPFQNARFIAAGADGAVWVGSEQGLARLESFLWKVVLTTPVEDMAMSPAGLWVNAGGLRLLSLTQPERRFLNANPTGELVVDTDGGLWFPCDENVCTMRPPDWHLESKKNPAPGRWQRIVPEKGGHRYWLGSRREIALVEGNIIRVRKEAPKFDTGTHINDPEISPNGTLWINRPLLEPLPGWGIIQSKALSAGRSFYPDDSMRWFGSTFTLGKIRIEEDWETWTGELFTPVTPQGFVAREHSLPVAYTTRGVVELTRRETSWKQIQSRLTVNIPNMINDGAGGYWLATLEEGLVRTSKDLVILERFPELCFSIDTIRGLLRDVRGRTWVGGKDPGCFFEVRGQPGKWKFIPQKLPADVLQAVAFKADSDGRPWVGYEYGIAFLADSGKWQRIQTSEPVTRVRSITFDGDNTIWVSHRQNGFFTRLERKGAIWQVRRFPADKYGPEDTLYLQRDSRGWIWRGTKSDVQVAKPGHYEPEDWLRINKFNGLASTGVSLHGWFEDEAGSVWLAGTGGITRLRPSDKWFEAPQSKHPIVARVTAGDHVWMDPNQIPSNFPATNDAIEIDLSGIDANSFQRAPLRYRLGGEWKSSIDGRLRFDHLQTGRYTLEAAYTGSGAAEVLRWQFQVGNPALQYVFPALSLAALAAAAQAWWRRRKWINYWAKKKIFLFWRRAFPGEDTNRQQITWTNYVGRTFADSYLLEGTLSHTESATTYIAKDLQSGDNVVVKVLQRVPGQETWMRNRFAHEVAALHTLSASGPVRLLNSWITPEGEPCLAMPYLDGPTLRKYLISHGPLDAARAAQIMEPLGVAVAAIHDCGIVHRDLKPENIILLHPDTELEQVVVIDFGTSAPRGPEAGEEVTTTVSGSMHYMAPERLAGHYSNASDVYSLGVILLEMLSGMRAAEFVASPEGADFIPALSAHAGHRAAESIAEALRHQPSRRPQNVRVWSAEVAGLLRDFSASRQVR